MYYGHEYSSGVIVGPIILIRLPSSHWGMGADGNPQLHASFQTNLFVLTLLALLVQHSVLAALILIAMTTGQMITQRLGSQK